MINYFHLKMGYCLYDARFLSCKRFRKIKKNTNTNRPILYNGRCKRHNLLIIQCKI